MEDLLVPDTPAGRRLFNSQEEVEEPSCCSPTRSKLKTSAVKVFSSIHILCGVLAIGLGVVACVFGCRYPGVAIVAGIVFGVTGFIGMFVTKHGVMAAVYGFLSLFSCLLSIALMVMMLGASSYGEGEDGEICYSHDCNNGYYPDNCCDGYIFFITWKNVAVDVAILVVAVVELVASWLATTMSLRDTDWITICCLKQNMSETQFPNSDERTRAEASNETAALSGQSPAMKRCWKPCESKGHRNLIIVLSAFHIIIGVFCVALGILAVFAECEVSYIGMPIWSGLLVFVVTGVYGLLSVTKKGSYIPCFLSLSILAFTISITMFAWSAANIGAENYNHYKYGCVDWHCYGITPTPYYCWDCLPGCCKMDDMSSHKDRNIRVLVDAFIVGFGVLETIICMVTFGLSFCQLSCYFCCRDSNCNCCETKNNGQYQMVMCPNGSVMMLPVPRAAQGMPMMVQHQIIAQNQQVGAQTSGTGELTRPEEQQVQGAQQPAIQAQGQPMLVQSPGQLMMVGGQGQPMMVHQGQGQPMMVHQGQVQPMMVHQGQGQPIMVHQGQGQPMMVHQGQGQPMMVHQGQGQPMFVQGVGQVGMVQGQGQPTNQTVLVPGQSQPLQTVTQVQIPSPEQQIQATGEPADTGEAMALEAGQDAGSILNLTV